MGNENPTHWHLDRRVPITILAVLGIQLVLLVSFFVGLDWRVKSLEDQNVTNARISVIESNVNALDRELSRLELRTISALQDIKEKLDRIDKRLDTK